MIFQFNKYKITYPNDKELKIALVSNYVLFEIAITVLGCALFSYFLWDKVNLDNIGILEFSLASIILTTAYNLFRNLILLLNGEAYVFNNSLNSITKNGRSINKLSSIADIRIIEHRDAESSDEYELQILLANNNVISFKKSTNLAFQKTLGHAVSKISGVPFNYVSKEVLQSKEDLKQQKIDRQPYIRIFEEKFKEKNEFELKEISKNDSPYADYAKEAAQNLLNLMNESNDEQTNAQHDL